jgi:hypothetical protein
MRNPCTALLLALPLLALAACGTEPAPGLGKGALVTFEMCEAPDGGPQRLTVFSTREAFAVEAERLADAGTTRIPVLDLRAGTTVDSQWSWHADPDTTDFADAAIEICDGCPADIEADTAYWLGSVRRFCPWGASVTRVTRTP